MPAIARKTDKGLPQYADSQESDTFILSGAEDLMPGLVEVKGEWVRDVTPSRTAYNKQYAIHRYRPRVEGLFARIERWINLADPQDHFWRSISRDNITTWYGKTAESRIADPSDPSRIFSWMICESYDDKGNVVAYRYKTENSDNVDLSQAHERNRSDASRSAKHYPKNVFYGNRTPYFPDLTKPVPVPLPPETDWCFELVFDYGEHDLNNPVPQDAGAPWDCRLDPFSTYRSTFDVRTYRLCRRALMFHHFATEPNIGINCLVRSTDLSHTPRVPPADPSQPFYSYLLSATQTGHVRDGAGGYISRSLPPLEFEYSVAAVDETVREVDEESLQNLPYGLDGSKYRWVDLDGEGLSGILTEQGGGWFYKANLSPVNQQTIGGTPYTLPSFAPVELVASKPALAALNGGRQQLVSLSGNGQLDLVEFDGPTPGFFERTHDGDWEPFATFPSLPVVDWQSPDLKFIDLTGDGFPDLLISEDNAFRWHASLGAGGFGPAQRASQAVDEELGPKLVFADGTESFFMADMSGDGLTDLVRIRNGEACYWPNLGYGRFGAKVTMDQSPWFDRRDLFDGRRIRLADIDGSGTNDLVYFGGGAVHLYFNQSGNGWGARRELNHFPSLESVSSATALDLLGNGTACLVWSSSLPGNARRPMRYIDLMGGQKPHLLVRSRNNLGAETLIQYAPSTRFYVADKLAGMPWVTRLPFPVQVVEQVRTFDYISRNLFVSRYSYHHGYFDGIEREFRGFGRVDQYDTEEFATLTNSNNFPEPVNLDAASHVPPALTKTWFHTGAFFDEARVSRYFEQEYYAEAGRNGAQLDDTILPTTILLPDGTRAPHDLSGEEMREACRALRGSILRQEIYALDGTSESGIPYSVSERNYTVEVFQPQGPNQYGVFLSHARETIDLHYERKLFKVAAPPAKIAADPRVTHAATLAIDPFGMVLQSVAIGYGRQFPDSALALADQATQSALLMTYTENSYTNAVLLDDSYRTPLAAQASTFELVQAVPGANIFTFDELQTAANAASDGTHDLAYENLNPAGLNAGEPYRRIIARTRTLYRPDDLGAAAGDPRALLALGSLESLALPGDTYQLAFTAGLISQVYQRAGTALLPVPANVLGSSAADGGGYVNLDGNWWIPSGQQFYLGAGPASPQEKDQAIQHFFLPRRFEDPFGHATTVDYDPHDLLVVTTTDAVGNVVSANNDYRVVGPYLVTDPNGNRGAVSFDALGLVVATAVMGKTIESLGDLLTGFSPDLQQADLDAFYNAADPHTVAPPLLGNATTRIVYDLNRYFHTGQPAFAATLAREDHFFHGGPLVIQVAVSYSDGFGREIQKKIPSEPGPVIEGGPAVNPRWVGSGWTIFNNKGKPVRQYEPFFSQLPSGHQFEFGAMVGVSPIVCYDPLQRAVATIHPNHTYEKVVFDPWHQETWDVNDTVSQDDPATDPDVGDFFARLPAMDYSPTWRVQRSGGALGIQEQTAAVKAAAHANTPTLAYFDTLGRTFLIIADNAAGGKYATRFELDIQNYQRSVTDALGRKVMAYDYTMPGQQIHQAGMEAGERWMLHDSSGKAIRAWDSRGHDFSMSYDVLRRPVSSSVKGNDAINSDPRTMGGVLYEKIDYGEAQPSPETLNLRTRVFQHFDSAGVVINKATDPLTHLDIAFDFKGNPLGNSRRFVQDHKALPDWSLPAPPFPDTFIGIMQYDALNRVVTSTTPDGSIVRPTYNEANLLEALSVNLLGAAAATQFVNNIDYNAKGQRLLIGYGAAGATTATTTYTYDPLTFRLAGLTTTRPGSPANQQTVQDLVYTHDPNGNITHIQDNADIQNVVYFKNQRVEPSADFTYDAIYRLIQASGREMLGIPGGGALVPGPSSYNDVPRAGILQPGDGQAMGTYNEQYLYDDVGNFLQFIHNGANPVNPGWTRSYTYNETSLLDPLKVSNCLTRTTVAGTVPLNEDYKHDLHGNMTGMPQLQLMSWDFKDQLLMTQRQRVNASDLEGALHQGERTYYVYDATGRRVRKTTESAIGVTTKERFYIGAFEVYREYDGAGNVTLERQTLQVSDDKRRIALVETKAAPLPVSSAIRFQFDNHLGTACLELNETADVITYEEYYPFGGTSYQAGRSLIEVSLKRYRFTGKERDEETGFYYHGTRYCAPWLGRWTAPDPTGLSDGVNLYVYVGDNPVILVDRTGNDGEKTDKSPPDTFSATEQKMNDNIASAQKELDKLKKEDIPLQVEQAGLAKELSELGPEQKGESAKVKEQRAQLQEKIDANKETLLGLFKREAVQEAVIAEAKEVLEGIKIARKEAEDAPRLEIQLQNLSVYNQPGQGKRPYFSSDSSIAFVAKNYNVIPPTLSLGPAELSFLHEPAFQLTDSVHVKDPDDTSKVTSHYQVAAQLDLLNLTFKRKGDDFIELKATGVVQYDATSKAGQAQLAPGVEVHATKGLSAVGQIQWPVDFATGKGAPPSVGLGVVGHF